MYGNKSILSIHCRKICPQSGVKDDQIFEKLEYCKLSTFYAKKVDSQSFKKSPICL